MDDLTILRDALGPAAPPAPAARAAARAALLRRIAGTEMSAREMRLADSANRTGDPVEIVADIRPAMLGQFADDRWARHRDGNHDRACDAGTAQRRRQLSAGRGRPGRFLLTGAITVTVAAAAAAAAVIFVGASPASRSQRSPSPAAVPSGEQSARTFLLASAVEAASAPAATGTYWYTKERDVEPTIPFTGTRSATKAGQAAKARKLFLAGITYTATEESWMGQNRGRTIVDENLTFRFKSAAVKARWQAMGSPPLATADGTSTRPSTSNYDMTFRYFLGAGLTMAGIERLPATAAGLGATLRRMWNSIPDSSGNDTRPDKAAVVGLPHPTFADYVFGWTSSLLTGPTTPGTRAAAYQLLAQQPGITIIPSVTDPLGRTGVAIADGHGYGRRDYMVIDPMTARELAYTTQPVHANSAMSTAHGGVETYEMTGWTNQLGARPES
jgi:hypothetical protein